MTFAAPHTEPAVTGAEERRAPTVPRPRPGLGAFPPPSGPRLDPSRPPGAPGPVGPGGPVDWWGWQARVRGASGSGPVAARPVPTVTAVTVARRGVLVLLLAGVGVLVAGGLVAGGRRRPLPRPSPAAAEPAPIAGSATVSATPLELVGVSDLPAPPPPPASEPGTALVPLPPRATRPVATTTVDLVDPTRPAVPRGDAATADGRLLRTVIRVPDAPEAGPFPLVVFAHGYATSTAAYGLLLDDLAAAGYVVAAPELPVTSTAYRAAVGDREPAEQVEDLRFVISSVAMLAAGDGPLRGLVREGPVVVVGHSDGGMTAAAVAFSKAARDDRIGAAVVLSGARLPDDGPWFPAGSPALLAVHGDADDVNPFAASQSLYAADRSGSPRYLVRVRDAGHTDAFLGPRTRPALVALIDDFVRAAVGADGDAAARLPADASVPGVLDLIGS